MKKLARLEQWKVTEEQTFDGLIRRLEGLVFGHDKIPDGRRVSTSLIVTIDDKQAETLNTVYDLGVPFANFN